MRTVLVHDWMVGLGGGEKVLRALHEMYPVPIYTLIHNPKALQGTYFEKKEIHSSFIQKLPFAKKLYRNYLPFFPLAIEQFNLGDYNLILSNSHAVAKGVLTTPSQMHICYCNTPMRYAWDLYHFHLEQLKGIKKSLARVLLHKLRHWDLHSQQRVDHFIGNSKCVVKRIKKVYGRDAVAIYPPVNVDDFTISKAREDYYFTCSRLVPYKRIDLLIKAFSLMPDKKLVIIGDGPEMPKLKKMAAKNVELLGEQTDEVLKQTLARSKAFLFAAEEDFGIVAVEAQASGVPVIAYGKGGSLETVISGKTGIFFPEQNPTSIIAAIQAFEKQEHTFDPLLIQSHAKAFSKERFQREMREFINTKWKEFTNAI